MKKLLKIAAVIFISLLVVMASATYFFLKNIEDTGQETPGEFTDIPDPPKKNERTNVLLLGVDAGDPTDKKAPKRSDTIILASFDPEKKTLDIISIPRDTRVAIKGHGNDKAGHAHAFGGPSLAMDTIGNMLNIDIHYYFSINYQGFKQFIDNLGGVRMNVPKDMNYYDPNDNPPLIIDLKKGWQTLNGEKALQLVRYRENGDIGRIQTQQLFIDAVIDKVLSAGTILRLPAIAQTLSNHLSSNMSPSEMSKYAFKAAGIGKDDIKMYSIPGDSKYINGISYFIYDEQKTDDLVTSIFGDDNDRFEKAEDQADSKDNL
jgi:LCP family protein required for cell wall assembly